MTDPHEIAKRLTEAQKRALPKWRGALNFRGGFLVFLHGIKWERQISAALVERGLLQRDKNYPGVKTITDLGRAVLAVLDKEPTDD